MGSVKGGKNKMPEIPEVTAFGAYVKNHCLKKVITLVQSTAPQLIKNINLAAFKQILVGDQFESVSRLGKYLVIDLKKSKKKLVMHFGLTGFLTYLHNHENVRYSCVNFIFNDHSELHYNSVRKFGKLWLIDSIDEIKELKNLGTDPLKFSEKQFLALIADNKPKNIKVFLMDQTIIAGIGNEYSDEILFQAGIDPRRTINDLSVAQKKRLFKMMGSVLNYAIKLRMHNLDKIPSGGFFSQVDKDTFKTSYLQAHRHSDGKCPHNKNHELARIKINGRTSYFCPIDQR